MRQGNCNGCAGWCCGVLKNAFKKYGRTVGAPIFCLIIRMLADARAVRPYILEAFFEFCNAHVLFDNQGVGGCTSRASLHFEGISLSSAMPS